MKIKLPGVKKLFSRREKIGIGLGSFSESVSGQAH
jgi:hypothetical protein